MITELNQARYELAAAMMQDVAELTGDTLSARFCSYCGLYQGLKAGHGQTMPTHGICPECKEEQLAYAQASAGRGLV